MNGVAPPPQASALLQVQAPWPGAGAGPGGLTHVNRRRRRFPWTSLFRPSLSALAAFFRQQQDGVAIAPRKWGLGGLFPRQPAEIQVFGRFQPHRQYFRQLQTKYAFLVVCHSFGVAAEILLEDLEAVFDSPVRETVLRGIDAGLLEHFTRSGCYERLVQVVDAARDRLPETGPAGAFQHEHLQIDGVNYHQDRARDFKARRHAKMSFRTKRGICFLYSKSRFLGLRPEGLDPPSSVPLDGRGESPHLFGWSRPSVSHLGGRPRNDKKKVRLPEIPAIPGSSRPDR